MPAPGGLPIGAAPPIAPLEPVPLGDGVEPLALEGAVVLPLVEPEPMLEDEPMPEEPVVEGDELAPEVELVPLLEPPMPVVPHAVSTSAQARGMVHLIITFSF